MKNPCFDPSTKTDCPNRRGGCSVTCEKWAEYVKERDEDYEKRKILSEGNGAFQDVIFNRLNYNNKRAIYDRYCGRRRHK